MHLAVKRIVNQSYVFKRLNMSWNEWVNKDAIET